LHIYVPTCKKYDYEQVKNFAQIISARAQELVPDFTTLERNLKKRGPNRIYMDFLQNRSGQTISSVYSLRPKDGAPVSTPLEWKELKKGLVFKDFNIKTIHKRLEKKGDIFKGVLGPGIDMLKALKKLNS
jgi:bifunctional non-homologous end joining protein LigD